MNNKKLSPGATVATAVAAQPAPVDVPEAFKDAFNYLQGNLYEDGAMHFLREMKNTIWTHFDTFIADAQALAAIFMLIFFAIKSYEMMTGDKKLEIMPLLRPFGLVMVIVWWGAFIRVLAYPTDVVAARTESLFADEQIAVNNLRMQRAKLMVDLHDQLLTIQSETELAAKEADTWYEKAWESVKSGVKEGFTTVWNQVVQMRNRFQVGLKLLVSTLLETLALWFLRSCVYLLFILQTIFSTILIILGPFAVAASILPAFRDSFSTWIARFVAVNLYSGIGYLVLYVASLFHQYALEAEITRYQALLDSSGDVTERLAWFASSGLLTYGMVIVTFLIGGLTMLTVPSISTWIISTSGISSAIGTLGRGGSSVARTMTRMISKL